MEIASILGDLRSRGIGLAVVGGDLIVDHHGELHDGDRELIRPHKAGLVAILAELADLQTSSRPSVDRQAVAARGDELRAQGLASPLCWLPDPQECAVLPLLPGARVDGQLWFE